MRAEGRERISARVRAQWDPGVNNSSQFRYLSEWRLGAEYMDMISSSGEKPSLFVEREGGGDDSSE